MTSSSQENPSCTRVKGKERRKHLRLFAEPERSSEPSAALLGSIRPIRSRHRSRPCQISADPPMLLELVVLPSSAVASSSRRSRGRARRRVWQRHGCRSRVRSKSRRKVRVAHHASRIVPRSDDNRSSTRDRSRSDDDATMARRARPPARVRLERCSRKVTRRDCRRGRT
jgi:hypothetical protein